MDCSRWRELASDYIEGTVLADDTAQALRAHAASCADCRADETALRALWREMNVLPSVDPPLFFRDNVMAAIERQAPQPLPFWRTLLPQLGRVALGTAVTGSAVAAVAWMLLLPAVTTQNAAGVAPLSLLPGSENASASEEADATPELRIARVTTLLPDAGPSYDFTFWLENASQGTVRFQLLGDREMYRFTLRQKGAQTLRVPFAAAQGDDTLNLFVYWTANGSPHAKYLFVPVVKKDSAPAEKQSFGLPESTLAEAARRIAARYGVPVTLEDVPHDLRVAVTASNETAAQALRRHVASHDLRVSVSRAGVLVAPAANETTATTQADTAAAAAATATRAPAR